MITEKRLYQWIANQPSGRAPVSNVAITRTTQNNTCIGFVFTPAPLRGKGFATRMTAALTAEILREKKYASLLADELNPTSNKIYQKIGYKYLYNLIHYRISRN
eukprot:TRINITY_DN8303_c0_g1_i1.p1 TRINITY_DN8303_c0_g1~~TRINITY_DN8303_c0_g1_i1.p1  ORF type:complete len:104 (-),score=15.07 TRINITY_DN8303_c0_g1_i1:2-313(-)